MLGNLVIRIVEMYKKEHWFQLAGHKTEAIILKRPRNNKNVVIFGCQNKKIVPAKNVKCLILTKVCP